MSGEVNWLAEGGSELAVEVVIRFKWIEVEDVTVEDRAFELGWEGLTMRGDGLEISETEVDIDGELKGRWTVVGVRFVNESGAEMA